MQRKRQDGYKLKRKVKNKLKSIPLSSVARNSSINSRGEIIILMKDCQVTGGYPRIFQLNEESINHIAQKKTNDIVKFKIV